MWAIFVSQCTSWFAKEVGCYAMGWCVVVRCFLHGMVHEVTCDHKRIACNASFFLGWLNPVLKTVFFISCTQPDETELLGYPSPSSSAKIQLKGHSSCAHLIFLFHSGCMWLVWSTTKAIPIQYHFPCFSSCILSWKTRKTLRFS